MRYLFFVFVIVGGELFGQMNSSEFLFASNYKSDMTPKLHNYNFIEKVDLSEFLQDSDSTETDNSQMHPDKLFYQGKLHAAMSASIGIDVINSLSIVDVVAIGVGTGLRFPFDYNAISIPVYLDLRLTLSKKRLAPILEGGWGVTFQPNSNYETVGHIYMVEGGVKIKGKEKFAYMISIGYESYDILNSRQTKSFGYGSYGGSYLAKARKKTVTSATLNFGFLF